MFILFGDFGGLHDSVPGLLREVLLLNSLLVRPGRAAQHPRTATTLRGLMMIRHQQHRSSALSRLRPPRGGVQNGRRRTSGSGPAGSHCGGGMDSIAEPPSSPQPAWSHHGTHCMRSHLRHISFQFCGWTLRCCLFCSSRFGGFQTFPEISTHFVRVVSYPMQKARQSWKNNVYHKMSGK